MANAFTLLEVIVACAIFFMAGFAILNLVTTSLVSARALQQHDPDPGIVAAAFWLTNKIEEGSFSGTFEDIAPGMYPGFRWELFTEEVHSNGMFLVSIIVHNEGSKKVKMPQTMHILKYAPGSPPGAKFGTFGGGVAGGKP